MKKIIISGLIATSALFAFPGMAGGSMHGNAGMVGKPLPGLKDSTVLAEVNGKKITVKELNYYLQGITGDNRIRVQDLPAQHIKQFVKQYADVLTLYKKAKEIEKTPQFQAAKMKLAVDMWLKDRYNKIKISDAEAKKFYEEKIQTANFFFNRVLPRIESYYLTATSGSKYIMDFKFN